MDSSDGLRTQQTNDRKQEAPQRPLFRWLHIYLSMVSFGILFFFAVTGVTLKSRRTGFLAPAMRRLTPPPHSMPSGLIPTKHEVVANLRLWSTCGNGIGLRAPSASSGSNRLSATVVFKGPGYSAEASIDRQRVTTKLNETRIGFVAVINDLHKARDTGRGLVARRGFVRDPDGRRFAHRHDADILHQTAIHLGHFYRLRGSCLATVTYLCFVT